MMYERICNFFEKFPIILPKDLEKKYKEEIEFSELNVTPKGIFSTSIYLPLFLSIFFFFLSYIFKILSLPLIFSSLIFSSILFYFLLNFPSSYCRFVRVRANSEMMMCIVYMAISLQTYRNMEIALDFAAQNLRGPLGKDLKRISWELKMKKIYSVEEGLNKLTNKWRYESQEFVEALSLLRSSLLSPNPDEYLREAIRIMVDHSKRRMKEYVIEMKTPLRIINAFGILLPLLSLLFLPMLIIFIPEIGNFPALAFFFNISLPLTLLFISLKYYFTRTSSFHQINIESLVSYIDLRKKIVIISLIFFFVSFLLLFNSSQLESRFSNFNFLYSYIIIFFIFIALANFLIIPSYFFLERNKEIVEMEEELPQVLLEISIISKTGKSIEKLFVDLLSRLSNMKSYKLFYEAISFQKVSGKTLEEVFFDKEHGLFNKYPSKIINAMIKVVFDISKKGGLYLSLASKSISDFLSSVLEVDKSSREILADIISEMELQSKVLAPIVGGIVIGLFAIVSYIFGFMEITVETGGIFNQTQPKSYIPFPLFSSFKLNIPFFHFHLLVGFYLIEIVLIISYLNSEILFGENTIRKSYEIGKTLILSFIIYTFVSFVIALGIGSFLASQFKEFAS